MKTTLCVIAILMLGLARPPTAAAMTEQDAVREYGYVKMKDGTRLAYVVWRPKAKGKYPTILNYSAYADSAASFASAKGLLEAGYAYIGANIRGTGSSEGVFSYYQPLEATDGAQVVEWAAAQPWSTGNVGMVGGSYGGHTQIKVAAQRPPHLRAITPSASDGNEFRDEGMTGGMLNIGLMSYWGLTIQPQLARMGAETRIRDGDTQAAAIRAIQQPNRAYQEAREHPLYDEWWQERCLDTMAARIEVPTLIIHGWQDEWIRPNGVLRVFQLLSSKHKNLLVQNGPHSLSKYSFIHREQMRWLDRWVKGERNGAEADEPVKVSWEVVETPDGKDANPGWQTTYAAWPVPTLQWATFYLTAEGNLAKDLPVDGDSTRDYVYPLGTELAGSNEQFLIPPYPHGSLSYRTAPMESDMALLGSPQLTFYLSSEGTDTDFKFTLKDIDPDGNALFLQRTMLRASLRAVDPKMSSANEIIQAFVKVEPLEPGKVYEMKLSLTAFGHVVRKGHRLELSILAPNTVPDPIWAFLPVGSSVINTVHHGKSYPSLLRLPVVPGESARAPAPPLGVLRNQPYRPADAASWFCRISSSTSRRHCPQQ